MDTTVISCDIIPCDLVKTCLKQTHWHIVADNTHKLCYQSQQLSYKERLDQGLHFSLGTSYIKSMLLHFPKSFIWKPETLALMWFDGPRSFLAIFWHLLWFNGPKNLMWFNGPTWSIISYVVAMVFRQKQFPLFHMSF